MTSLKPAPLSTDTEAILELQNTDFSKRITYGMIKSKDVHRKIRIYADGVYDLFHFGHGRQFEQCKNAFPGFDVYLIVGVSASEENAVRKGVTVMTDDEIVNAIRQCRYVDEVVHKCPYFATMEFLDKMKVDFLAHDPLPYYDPVTGTDPYQKFRDAGRFFPTQRTPEISTTDLIDRVVQNNDIYFRRNQKRREPTNLTELSDSQSQRAKNTVSVMYERATSTLQEEYLRMYGESYENKKEP